MTFARGFDRAWRVVAIVAFIGALAVPVGALLGFRLIVTSSVPRGLWWVHTGSPQRGAYVFICLPKAIGEEGRRAGYLLRGFCPGHVLPVMKRVIALDGDQVTVAPTGLSVNGVFVTGSIRLKRDSRGRPITTLVPDSRYRVAPDGVWLLGDWFKSWDSRYYGGVSITRLIGVGVPIFVLPVGA